MNQNFFDNLVGNIVLAETAYKIDASTNKYIKLSNAKNKLLLEIEIKECYEAIVREPSREKEIIEEYREKINELKGKIKDET